ncbi:MAG: hypothetical protein WAT09_18090 [Paracoccaceae bacterium]
MNFRDVLQWLRHKPGGARVREQGWRDTRAHMLIGRFAIAALLVLSPVVLLPFYMAVGTAGSTSALLPMLVANIALIVLGLRWLFRFWSRQDRKVAAAEAERKWMAEDSAARQNDAAKYPGPWQ